MTNPNLPIARIYNKKGNVVGAGFLIGNGQLITCTHVVSTALNISYDAQQIPDSTIEIDLPLVFSQSPKFRTHVIAWFPPKNAIGDDIAVLKVDALPEYVRPFHLASPLNLSNHQFRAYGFPNGFPNGIWSYGIVRESVAGGRVQIETQAQTGYSIEKGFSGTPICDTSSYGVLGIVISADNDSTARAAFMVSSQALAKTLENIIPDEYLDVEPIYTQETLYTNLLNVYSFFPRIYTAEASTTSFDDLVKILNEARIFEREFILKDKRIFTFHDLEQAKWKSVCDNENVEILDSDEWANSDDMVLRRDFVQLLNKCLREKVWNDLYFHPQKLIYYFKSTINLSEKYYHYQSLVNATKRRVFGVYGEPGQEYYRHSAFEGFFERYEGRWYLRITPTYYYSSDGKEEYRNAAILLKGIKRQEDNPAVFGQVLMWTRFLTATNMFTKEYEFLKFGDLKTFQVDFGFQDFEQPIEDDNLSTDMNDLPLFKTNGN